MHEWSLAQNIIEAAVKEAKERRLAKISCIHLEVNSLDLGHADGSSLQFCLEELAKGTIAEGAEMNIEVRPVEYKCRECSSVSRAEDALFVCPKCGSGNLDLSTESEMRIQITCVENTQD